MLKYAAIVIGAAVSMIGAVCVAVPEQADVWFSRKDAFNHVLFIDWTGTTRMLGAAALCIGLSIVGVGVHCIFVQGKPKREDSGTIPPVA
jgi:dipeptide/tripeptide permease